MKHIFGNERVIFKNCNLFKWSKLTPKYDLILPGRDIMQNIGYKSLRSNVPRPNFTLDLKTDRNWEGVLRPKEKKWGTFWFGKGVFSSGRVPPAGLG